MYNFRQQLKHSLALPEEGGSSESANSDSQMIAKLYINFFFNVLTCGVKIVFSGLLFKVSGGLTASFFPVVPLYLIQHCYALVKNFYKEIEKFVKFRRFLKNIDENYPLVNFDASQQEDCAICKDNMTQARKLPCNHAFHWLCIVQLIESGSKRCPICREEFNNVHRDHLQRQN